MSADHGMARMQELLSSYYGMQDKETEAENQRNIDAPGFNSSIYLHDMLHTMGLNELLQRDDTLIQEIKELDTNMQMLVYENYNKFISATDTIRKMKTNVASMETEVEKVMKSMDVITQKSEIVNVALAPHRSKVEKLIGVRRLLKRLEFIFELPQRLNTAVKQEEYATATRFFLVARRILTRYEHITSFKTIQVEADKIVKQLESLLALRLLNPLLTSSQVCEAVTLLAQLNVCTDEMKQHFLDWHQTYFENLLEKASSMATSDESVIYCMNHLETTVLQPLATVFRVYKQTFHPELDARLRNIKGQGRSRMSMVFQDDPFTTFSKEVFSKYLQVCATHFRRPHDVFGSLSEVHSLWKNDELKMSSNCVDEKYFVLMYVLKHFISQVQEVDAIIPPCNIASGATAIVENCVRYQIDLVFKQLRVETRSLLQKAHEQVHNQQLSNSRHNSRNDQSTSKAPSVQLMAQDMASTFTDMMKQVLGQMEPLVSTGASILQEMSRLFSELVQTQFYHFLTWFNTTMLLYTQPKRAFTRPDQEEDDEKDVVPVWLEPRPTFLIYLASLCGELANEGISECIHALIECLPTENNSHSKHGHEEQGTINRRGPDVTHMIQVTRDTSNELIKHISKVYGAQLCGTIRNGLSVLKRRWEDEEDGNEPRSVADMVVQVIEATMGFGKEIAIALGDEHSVFYATNGNSRTASRDFRRRTTALKSRGGGGGMGMQLDVERIFAKRIQIFHPNPELTTDWFVHHMLKMSMKAYGEWIREMVLTKWTLQQVQLDAEFLRATSTQLVNDSHELESLLSDLLSNAREQAMEDVLMEQSNVVAIVSSKSTLVLSRRDSVMS